MSFIQIKGGPAGKLDPQIAEIVKELSRGDNAENEPDLSAIRNSPDALLPWVPKETGKVAITEQTITASSGANIPIRVYKPDSQKVLPVVVFFHGGCWVFCDLDSHDGLCRYLATEGQAIVVSVDYRRAPESPFPAPIHDAYDATLWVEKNTVALGADPDKIIVCGDSAGGNIAAVVSIMARDSGSPSIAAQILYYPITDISNMNTPSHKAYSKGWFFEHSILCWASDLYTKSNEERLNHLVSPLLVENAKDLPPAIIITAEFDILRDEGEAYARKLSDAGVPTKAIRYNGAVHAFVGMAGKSDLGKSAIDESLAFLKHITT